MTLASWFPSMRHSRRRLTPNGARSSRSRTVHRRTSFEALEDRCLLSTVNFTFNGGSVDESAGAFAIPVALSSPPSGTPTVNAFAQGFDFPESMAVDAAGNVYVASYTDGTVSKITPAGAVSIYASGFITPVALAFDAAGDLFVSDRGDGTIYKVPAGGGAQTVFVSGFHDLGALAFDAVGTLYVCSDADTVSDVTPQGLVTGFATGFDDPDGLAFDATGNLYVANFGGETSGNAGTTVDEVTPSGTVTLFASGLNDPGGLAFDAAGNLYVANSGTDTVCKVTPAKVVTTFASGFDFPLALAFDSAGNLYVANSHGSTVVKVTQSVSVPFTVGGPAVSGVAYSGVTPSPLTFGIGQTSLNITGTLLLDPGPLQTVTFTLGTPTGGADLGSPSVYTLNIAEPALVQFSAGSETVNESTGTFSIPVTVSGHDIRTFTVPFSLGGSAVDGVAYSGITANPLTFGGGQTTADITGTLLSDPGPSQTLILTLGAASGGPVTGNTSSNTLTIDEPEGVQFSAVNETVSESAGTFSIPVTVSGSPAVSTFASGFDQPYGVAVDSAGNLYVANTDNNTVSELNPAGQVIATLSGFNGPFGLAFDSAGNLFVANGGGDTVSELNPAGQVIATLSGFSGPVGLAFDSTGNLYVVNSTADTVSKVTLTPTPVVSTFASGFVEPYGLAFHAGNLYVANADNDTVSKVTLTPTPVVSTFASGLSGPDGLAFDSASNLYVSNGNNTVSVVTPAGVASTSIPGFDEPSGLALAAGNLYVANSDNGTVSEVTETVSVPFTLGGTAVSGVAYSGVTTGVLTFALPQTTINITGSLHSDPGPTKTLTLTLGTPTGCALGSPSVNTLAITEPAVVQFGAGSETVNESAGTFSIPVTVSGVPNGATTVSTFASGFNDPFAVAVDSAGNVYVADVFDGTVSEVTPAGKVNAFASGFDDPVALAFDAAGNLYVANEGNGEVSEVSPAGNVSTFVGGFENPAALAFDSAGNLYVADANTGTVNEVTPARKVSTFASGFNTPFGLAFDAAGNLYVVNTRGNTVSKVSPTGLVLSNFASGFVHPIGVAVDAGGNLYVTNIGNNTVSEVTPAGVVSTFTSGFDGPAGLALDAGRMYVADTTNNTLSEVTQTLSVPFALGGTAASGVSFSGVTLGLLTFGIGQTTQDITGTLLRDPGPNQTLTFTLGTPTGGAVVGSRSLDTLTINESATGTSTPTSTAPLFLDEQRVFSGKGKHKKLKGFEFLFNSALNAGTAQTTGNYHVTQKHGKKAKVLRVESAVDNPSNTSVTISVAGFNTAKPTQVTITGLEGADGAAIPQVVSRL